MYDDVFNENYFDIADEGTATEKLFSGLTGSIGNFIGNISHNIKINKSRVLDYRNTCKIFGDETGTEYYEKSINFLIDYDLLNQSYADSKRIMFKDLTRKGKQFMRGYYSTMDRIQQFDYNTAKFNAKRPNDEAKVQNGINVVHVATELGVYIGQNALIDAVASIGITAVTDMFISALLPVLGCTVVASTFNIIDAIRSYSSSKMYSKLMRNAEENVGFVYDEFMTMYESGYNRALHDIGFDVTDIE